MKQLTLSFIIPAYNEAANLQRVHEAIYDEMNQLFYDYEILFIDDGSSDHSMEVIHGLSFDFPEVRYLSFTRNFGKESAILAGLQHAIGDAIIMMDADLQHPANMIVQLIKGFEEGYDQVIAKRNRQGDDRLKTLLATSYYRFVNKTIDVELKDGEGDFRLLSRKAVDALLLLSEGHRFSKGLYSWIGLEQKTIEYENVAREQGQSKFSFAKLLNYGIDGIVSFNNKPLRFCFYMGALTLLLSLFYIAFSFIQILQKGIDVPGYFTTITAVLLLGGIQLICMGIIGEYIGRIYNETKKRPHYLVKRSNVQLDREGESRYVIHKS